MKLPNPRDYVPSPGQAIDWRRLEKDFSWTASLRETPQDPDFHGEGDVWRHTRMVVETLIDGHRWQRLAQSERIELFWAALLHDIAKPICTRRQVDGTILSPNHTIRGEQLARRIFWTEMLPVPIQMRERIIKLIRYHGLPVWAVDAHDITKKVIAASQVANLNHLALLAEADLRGRICKDAEELLTRVALFREYARELDCLHRPYPFENGLARMTFLRGEGKDPAYVPFDDSWGRVLLMSGLPGAGKDSWLRRNGENLPVVSLDDIRSKFGIGPKDNQGKVIQTAKSRAKEFLRRHQPFAWNATNISRHLRKPLIDLFYAYGARATIVYIEPPYAQLLAQNRKRAEAVPEKVMQNLIDKLEVPDILEADEVLWLDSAHP